MEQMPDYTKRKALVSSTKDRLETLIAPQFMEVLDSIAQSTDSRLVEGLEHMISIFAGVNRSSVAVQYYITWMAVRYTVLTMNIFTFRSINLHATLFLCRTT